MDILDRLIAREGGDKVVNDPRDPGGLTKFGISQRAFPKLDIRNLTYDQAKEIYRVEYFVKPGINLLPQPLQESVLDYGVHSGVQTAILTLQRLVGVKQDGKIGAVTLAACTQPGLNKAYNSLRILALIRQVQAHPAKLYALGGWVSRVLSLI